MRLSFTSPPGARLPSSPRRPLCALRPARPLARVHPTASASRALILDCDGVIVESEELHRLAYNATWERFSLGFSWDASLYGELQNAAGGGRAKLVWYFDSRGWPARAQTPAARARLLDELTAAKTDAYLARVAEGVPARPGVARVIDEACARGVRVAVASAASRPACRAALRGALGEERVGRLAFVLAGDDVERKKPAGDIYEAAVERLGVPADECVVVEDSLIGVQAASAAGIAVAVTHTAYTRGQDFSLAAAVYPSLGGPEAPDDRLIVLDELLALRRAGAKGGGVKNE